MEPFLINMASTNAKPRVVARGLQIHRSRKEVETMTILILVVLLKFFRKRRIKLRFEIEL
jgi:hypothetical protein